MTNIQTALVNNTEHPQILNQSLEVIIGYKLTAYNYEFPFILLEFVKNSSKRRNQRLINPFT